MKTSKNNIPSKKTSRPTSMRPNILLIHTDQLRHDWLGCAGNSAIQTPHTDRIAKEGLRFTRHWVANTICQPSRASLLTGMLPTRHGVWCNGAALDRRNHAPGSTDLFEVQGNEGMDIQVPTIADHFGAAGYRTGCFGKVHLQPMLARRELQFEESVNYWATGEMENWYGPFYGFHHAELSLGHFEKQLASAGHYARWLKRQNPKLQSDLIANPPGGEHQIYTGPIPHALHNTSWLAERFKSWVGTNNETPFFAFVGFPGPHHPFSPSYDILDQFQDWDGGDPADLEGKFISASPAVRAILEDVSPPSADFRRVDRQVLLKARRYTAAMIWQIDDAVGRILQMLDARGLTENTIVAFTSDHGDFLGNHHLLMKDSMPCRDLLETPLLLRGPGIPVGALRHDTVSNIDVLPTLAAIAGIPCGPGVEGRDFLTSPTPPSGRAVAVCGNAIMTRYNRRLDSHTLADDRYRLSWYPHFQDYLELYDHHEDPWETCNLATNPSLRRHLQEMHQQLATTIAASSFPTNRRFALF